MVKGQSGWRLLPSAVWLRGVALCFAALITSCSGSDEPDSSSWIEMPVSISIPIEGEASRAVDVGDPGIPETWDLPAFAYIYLCTSDDQKNAIVSIATVELDPDPKKWAYNKALTDAHAASEVVANIYTYSEYVYVRMPQEQTVGRVYVALANQAIPGLSITPATEAQVKSLTFSVPDSDPSNFLKNLYSSPAGKLNDNGEYYGTIQGMGTNVPYLYLICYHVGAKLDVTWNVSPDVQAGQKITTITAKKLFKSGYIFQPSKSSVPTDPDGEYSESIISYVGEDDEAAKKGAGTWYYGRGSIYIIDPKQRGKLYFDIGLNYSDTPIKSNYEIPLTYSEDYNSTYTPWILGSITINKDLTTSNSNSDN